MKTKLKPTPRRPRRDARPPARPRTAALPANPLVDVLSRPAPPAGTDRPWLPDHEREFVNCLETAFRTFRMKVCEVWSRKSVNMTCARTVSRLQSRFPGFSTAHLTPETAAGVFDMIEALLNDAPWWRRPLLRRETAHLLAELYDANFKALREHGLLERVEQLYLAVKE